MKQFYYLYVITFIFIVVACGSNTYKYDVAEKGLSYSSEQASDGSYTKNDVEPSVDISKVDISDRKLIKEGNIRFETENIEKTRKAIDSLTKAMNGYISRENIYDYSEQKMYEMVVRIPSQVFDNFVKNVSSLITKLESKDINVKDVTEEYIDVESRIKSKKEILNRYTELLKKAKNVAEILDIEREIGKIEVELNAFQVRLKYLQNQVSYSTLTIFFYEHQPVEFGFFKKIKKAIESGWNGLLWIIVFIFYLWPLWIFLAAVAWFVVYLIKRKGKN